MYMKKIISLFAFCTLLCTVHARTVEVETTYTGSSRFDKVHVSAAAALNLNVQAGLEATLANEHHLFNKPVYSVAVPVFMDFDLIQFRLRPFYYFKNKSSQPEYQDASAYGVQGNLILALNQDTVNDIYTHAFIGAAFARQKGTVFFDNRAEENRYYSQAAYTLGFEQEMYRAFHFRAAVSAFQYPDGITGVSGIRTILDQQDLAHTQTLEIVHDLAKYTLDARAARVWADNGSSFYVGYRFAEYYTADSDHSVLIGNSFPVTKQINLDLAYNHLMNTHNHNRRDIWQARLNMVF